MAGYFRSSTVIVTSLRGQIQKEVSLPQKTFELTPEAQRDEGRLLMPQRRARISSKATLLKINPFIESLCGFRRGRGKKEPGTLQNRLWEQKAGQTLSNLYKTNGPHCKQVTARETVWRLSWMVHKAIRQARYRPQIFNTWANEKLRSKIVASS